MTSIKDRIFLFLKGMGMGGADIIPGVSGGTIAFITGIYQELLDSISNIDKTSIQLVRKKRYVDVWQRINGPFLSILFSGILLSIFTLSRLISYLMKEYPIQLWSFFFGLILISAITIVKDINKWNYKVLLAGLLGLVVAYGITTLSPATTSNHWIYILLSGMISITAMILPGISGSFILLLLGKYEFVINAVKNFDLLTIFIFGSGCIIGLLLFSRAISWALKHYAHITIALLSGFMLGSLNKIWPWKRTLTYRMDSEGKQVPLTAENILPNEYAEIFNQSPLVLEALLFFALGIGLVVVLEKIAKSFQKKAPKY